MAPPSKVCRSDAARERFKAGVASMREGTSDCLRKRPSKGAVHMAGSWRHRTEALQQELARLSNDNNERPQPRQRSTQQRQQQQEQQRHPVIREGETSIIS